jgi:hypothetical protein
VKDCVRCQSILLVMVHVAVVVAAGVDEIAAEIHDTGDSGHGSANCGRRAGELLHDLIGFGLVAVVESSDGS